MDHRFAIEGRRLAYWHFLRWGRPALVFNDGHAPGWQRLAVRPMFPLIALGLRRILNVTDESRDRAAERVESELAWLDTVVPDDDSEFLFGDRFTAADLTLGSLSAPLILPRNYGARMPTDDEMPDHLLEFTRRYRATKAGRFAVKTYERHRWLPSP